MGAIAANTVISWTDSEDGDHHGALLTRANGHDVIDCAICGYRHVVPLPDPAAPERASHEADYRGKMLTL